MFAIIPAPGGIAPGIIDAAGTMNVTLPLTSAVGPNVAGPAYRITVPVGTGLPPAACTVIVTVSVCASATLGALATITVGEYSACPLSATCCVEPATFKLLSVTVSVPLIEPPTACGVKLKPSTQFAPGASTVDAVHVVVPGSDAKLLLENVSAETVNGDVPRFVSMSENPPLSVDPGGAGSGNAIPAAWLLGRISRKSPLNPNPSSAKKSTTYMLLAESIAIPLGAVNPPAKFVTVV
jgi:hypothetical protein